MQKAKWDMDFANGHSLTVEIPNSACVVWTTTYKHKVYTQAYIHSQLFVAWPTVARHFPCRVLQRWERFPADSKESGIYVYLCTDSEDSSLANSLNMLFDLGALAPIETGPAVIDVPIVCLDRADEIYDVKKYIRGLGRSDAGMSAQQSFELFDLACKQFNGFPKELQCQLLWYKKNVEHERDVLCNLLKRIS